MQYGITIPTMGPLADPRTLADLARDAEAAGWDGFFIWDEMVFDGAPVTDTTVTLAAIAMQTARVRFGPLVTPLPRRRPHKVAREMVALDHLSGGRLVLGVGTGVGSHAWEYLGEEADPKTRGAMLDDALDILTGLWSGEPFRHEGTHYTIGGDLNGAARQTRFVPTPVQSPRIPIWVGGVWPNKPPFRRAARWDGIIPLKKGAEIGGMLSPDELRDAIVYIRQHRTSDAPFDVVMPGGTPGDDPARAVATVARYADAGATWWLETVDPWNAGWQGQGDWPVAAMHRRIRQGPPKG